MNTLHLIGYIIVGGGILGALWQWWRHRRKPQPRFPTFKEVEENPVFHDPGAKEQGPGYQPQWGATIYPDSEVLTCYVGSAQEEVDRKTDIQRSSSDKTGTTCPQCFGWGDHGFAKCSLCHGKGSI